jgi:hypothetical protein
VCLTGAVNDTTFPMRMPGGCCGLELQAGVPRARVCLCAPAGVVPHAPGAEHVRRAWHGWACTGARASDGSGRTGAGHAGPGRRHGPGCAAAPDAGAGGLTRGGARGAQANSEVSALLGRIPSAVGYQPTLATDLGGLQERITTTKKGSITSVQARAAGRAGGLGPRRVGRRPGWLGRGAGDGSALPVSFAVQLQGGRMVLRQRGLRWLAPRVGRPRRLARHSTPARHRAARGARA